MKKKKQGPKKNQANKRHAGEGQTSQAKAGPVPAALQFDRTDADFELADKSGAVKKVRPSIFTDKATGMVIGFSMEPPTRKSFKAFVEEFFSQAEFNGPAVPRTLFPDRGQLTHRTSEKE